MVDCQGKEVEIGDVVRVLYICQDVHHRTLFPDFFHAAI
ncbi:hypothetical protein AAKU64_004296 [Undibacterium sp. GrIS 1.8]